MHGAVPPFYPQGTALGSLVTGLVLEQDGGARGGAGGAGVLRVPGRRQELPVTARLHLPGHARVTPDALEVPRSNFNFIVSQSFSGSS